MRLTNNYITHIAQYLTKSRQPGDEIFEQFFSQCAHVKFQSYPTIKTYPKPQRKTVDVVCIFIGNLV